MEAEFTVITGGSRGLGSAILSDLQPDYNIINISRTRPFKDVIHMECDLSDNRQLYDLVDNLSRYKIKNYIHCAGVDINGDYLKTDTMKITATYNINTVSAAIISRAVLDNMIENNINGNIIYISSIWSEDSAAGKAIYSSTKHALNGLCKGLALEFINNGIHINCISPGFVDVNQYTKPTSSSYRTIRHLNRLKKKIPGGELMEPSQVCEMVRWLLQTNTYMSGQNIKLDRGRNF